MDVPVLRQRHAREGACPCGEETLKKTKGFTVSTLTRNLSATMIFIIRHQHSNEKESFLARQMAPAIEYLNAVIR